MSQVTVKTDIPQTVNYQSCTVQAGTTTTLASDQNASVSNSGTEYNAVLNFGIPRGKSAYEQAVEGGYAGTEEEFEQALASDIATVASNISDVNSVGQSITDVNSVASNLTDISTVANNVSDVNAVAGISSDVTQVSSISNAVQTVSSHDSDVTLVSDNMASVMTTASNISDVNTVAGISTDVSTVAGIEVDVSAVEDIKTDVSAVASNATNITAVANNETNINAVNSNKTNIDAVAGNSTNINAVAGNETNINAVNANKTNIDAVAGNNTNITTVATNISNVNTTVTNMAAIIAAPTAAQNAATSATNAQTWAEGTDTAVTALGGEHSSKGWAGRAQQIVESLGAIYKPAGSIAFASLPALSADVLGNVYNITDAFTTTADFVEGAGNNYPAGTNVAVVDVGTGGSHSYKFDVLSGVVDLSAYRTAAAQDVIDSGKQATLVSGTNIKTVNNNSLLGSGNVDINGLPTQTGQSGKFLTTDGTDASWSDKPLTNTATGTNSLTILGTANANNSGVNIGYSSRAGAGSVAIGKSARASGADAVAIGELSEAINSYSIGIGFGKARADYAIQLGYGINTEANSMYVGTSYDKNWKMLCSDGTIPVARLNTMTGADGANAGAKGAVPAPAATDNTKFLKGDGTWATVDALPSQTGNQGKYLTTNGTTASWDIPMAGLPMFYATYQPRKLNNASWLRADPYSWHSADVYVSAYAHLADNISGVTAETETVAGTTITYYRLSDEIKVVLPDQETNLDTIYNATGIGYYFVLDTTNRQFKLPRNIYGFTGYRGDVGGYVAPGLPNITGSTGIYISGGDGPAGAFYNSGSGNGGVNAIATGSKTLFDASRSSAIYGNSTTVQPPATQAYLYFYVGNTVQNETSVDVAETTEAINDKVDLSSSWGTLSTTYDNLTEPSNNGYLDVTATADGWLYYARRKDYGNSNTTMWALNTSHTEMFQIEHDGYWGGTLVSILCPVKKGETIRFGRNNLTGDFVGCRFYYAQKTN